MRLAIFWVSLVSLTLASLAQEGSGFWVRMDAQCGAPSGSMRSMHADATRVWAGTEAATLEFRDGRCWPHRDVTHVRSMASDARGNLWAWDGHQLWRYSEGTWTRNATAVTRMVTSAASRAVTGSPCYQPTIPESVWPHVPVDNGVPYVRPGMASLAAEPGGALWLAYSDPGPHVVVRFAGEQLECWDGAEATPSGPADQATGVGVSGSGGILVTWFEPPSTTFFDGTAWSRRDAPRLVGMSAGVDGSLVGYGDGVHWFEDGAWRTVYGGETRRAVPDGAGGVWLLTQDLRVLHVMEGARASYGYPVAPDPSSNRQRLALDHRHALWLGCDAGVFRLELGNTVAGRATWGEVKRASSGQD